MPNQQEQNLPDSVAVRELSNLADGIPSGADPRGGHPAVTSSKLYQLANLTFTTPLPDDDNASSFGTLSCTLLARLVGDFGQTRIMYLDFSVLGEASGNRRRSILLLAWLADDSSCMLKKILTYIEFVNEKRLTRDTASQSG